MANLRKCSRCKSEIDISYFGMNRKKNHIKHVIIVETNLKKQVKQHHYQILKIHQQQQKHNLQPTKNILLLWTLKQQD